MEDSANSSKKKLWRVGIIDHNDAHDLDAPVSYWQSHIYDNEEEARTAARGWNAGAAEDDGMWADFAIVVPYDPDVDD